MLSGRVWSEHVSCKLSEQVNCININMSATIHLKLPWRALRRCICIIARVVCHTFTHIQITSPSMTQALDHAELEGKWGPVADDWERSCRLRNANGLLIFAVS